MAGRGALAVTRLRNLAACVSTLIGQGGRGSCFHRAAALALDLPGSVLCIGTLRGATADEHAANPHTSPVAFVHAWLELPANAYGWRVRDPGGRVVLAPTLLEAAGTLHPIPRAVYYAANDVRDVHRLERARVLELARAHGWQRYFRTGKSTTGEPLGAVLLEAAGVPHRLGDNGAVLPPAGRDA